MSETNRVSFIPKASITTRQKREAGIDNEGGSLFTRLKDDGEELPEESEVNLQARYKEPNRIRLNQTSIAEVGSPDDTQHDECQESRKHNHMLRRRQKW